MIKRRLNLIGLVLAALVLAACTASKPPPYQGIEGNDIIPGQEIIVGKNENVYTIARNHGVRMREIIALNNLQPPFTLKIGQHLVLPAKGGSDAGEYAPVPSSAPMGVIDQAPLAAGTSVGSAAMAPMAAPPASPMLGGAVQTESLPPVEAAQPAKATPPASASNINGGQASAPPPATTSTMPFGIGPSTPEPVVAGAGGAPETPAASPAAASPTPAAEASSAAPASSGQFAWPVQGTVISNFGSNNGVNNDGINIAAPKGAPVMAAAGGIVVYTGNEMKGFGNLVLIRHEGGWVTAYAHLDRVTVAKDSVVAPGDMIGTVGTTGGISSPQLHFETRQEGKPVDPMGMLRK
jgi:murein DD-endopeptidase MepM/ murein hydrolase activator NlpD